MRPRLSDEIKNRAIEHGRRLLAEEAAAEVIKKLAVSTKTARAEINKRTLNDIVALAAELGQLGSDNIDPTAFDVFLGTTKQKRHWLNPTETIFNRDGRQGWVVAQRIAYLAPKHPRDKSDNVSYLVKTVALMNDGNLIVFPQGKPGIKYDKPGYIERLDRQRKVENKKPVERLMISYDGSILDGNAFQPDNTATFENTNHRMREAGISFLDGNTFLLDNAATVEDAANRLGEAGIKSIEDGLVSFIAQHDLADKL